ncbi:hypothetical protein ACGFI4_08480 [Micromonospora carbonacea]|uniref:hypothetical protein n=1 Tax=Micromonospora carbonacea TaxID=47853 RepID=UPI0037130C6B
MNLDLVAEELRTALGTIDGLSTPEWGVQRINPPAAMAALPDEVTYDMVYRRGGDRVPDWQVLVLIARPTQPEARRAIAAYADGSGAQSVKAAIEAHEYVACDVVTVTRAEFEVVTYAGTEYLAAVFHLDVVGKGA